MIFLSYNKFTGELPSYLSLGIRIVTYFKGRGQHDSVKWHHVGAITKDGYVLEALIRFTKHHFLTALSAYDKVVYLRPTFKYDENKFNEILEDKVGQFYNFWAIFCMLIYQLTGMKIQKKFKLPVCSNSTAEAFYLSCDESVRHYFENHAYMDPQDFVRLWKNNKLFEIYDTDLSVA